MIELPSEFQMDSHCIIADDVVLIDDLVMDLSLIAMEPFPLEVPCVDGLGSW